MSTITVETITANANILESEGTGIEYLVLASSANITLTLPNAGTTTDGFHFWIKRIDTASIRAVTISCSGTDKIDGASTRNVSVNQALHILCYQGKWWIMNF